ncbi:hypothetical protein [Legionella brunensis]|uniref:Neurogenic locus notch like protein n=1 Tax=Legionella brunensis TaxID=29422 RepID=A0A0W0S0S4_9GAMM|nr:hypothetical protein [Legionella brunensis]KTC77052.1 hypothetical protein Lbru_3159 [Legionella brunensis]
MKGLLLLILLIANINLVAQTTNFIACASKYALCTTAKCTPVAGKKGIVACDCDVKTGYSAGTKQCQQVKNTKKGQLIYSRYYPIKSYASCANSRPWAWCLDKPCIIDPKNPSKAACACSVVKNLGNYVIVTDTYQKSTCTTGLISSATIAQLDQITNFLKTQKAPRPFPIKVVNQEQSP